MSDRFRASVAIYISTLACILAFIAMKEDDYRSRASRLDQKVMTAEILRQSSVIIEMGKWRNQSRAKAERMERAVLFVTLAIAVSSPALIAGVALGAWTLLTVSGAFASTATFFAVWAIWPWLPASISSALWFAWMAVT